MPAAAYVGPFVIKRRRVSFVLVLVSRIAPLENPIERFSARFFAPLLINGHRRSGGGLRFQTPPPPPPPEPPRRRQRTPWRRGRARPWPRPSGLGPRGAGEGARRPPVAGRTPWRPQRRPRRRRRRGSPWPRRWTTRGELRSEAPAPAPRRRTGGRCRRPARRGAPPLRGAPARLRRPSGQAGGAQRRVTNFVADVEAFAYVTRFVPKTKPLPMSPVRRQRRSSGSRRWGMQPVLRMSPRSRPAPLLLGMAKPRPGRYITRRQGRRFRGGIATAKRRDAVLAEDLVSQ